MHGKISRRHFLVGTGLLAAGGTGMAYGLQKPPIELDRNSASERDIYDRGLVPIERSGWTQPQGIAAPYPVLERSLDVDIAIVGAGLAGSSLALHLAEAGVIVAILEARQPGWGASGRNAGHVLPILKDLTVLESFPDGGKEFLDAFREHHTIPFDLADKYQIECDAVRSGYLNVMRSKKDFEVFRAAFAYLEKDGIQKVSTLTGADMETMTGSRYYSYGVMFENGGRINPYLLTNGMIAAASLAGARVHGDSEALSLSRVGKRWRIRTAKGDVLANRVIFCTAAYPTHIVPHFETCFYPLTAYALTTRPLDREAAARIMPGGATLAQVPVDLNPLVKDRHDRLILSSLPAVWKPEDAEWHFRNQLAWIHKVWPETKGMDIRLDQYWTGRVAMRTREFPGAFDLGDGLFGLMHFNAWGNVMAPLMGKLLAEGLIRDEPDRLPFPLERPKPVFYQPEQEILLRRMAIPAARMGQKLGLI